MEIGERVQARNPRFVANNIYWASPKLFTEQVICTKNSLEEAQYL